MSPLFVVATPIGNLEDVTHRALRVLREADLVLCEDTRVTRKLFSRYGIGTPLRSYRQHSGLRQMEEIWRVLEEGKALALVTDSGTPGISDPGNELVAFLSGKGAAVVPVPGPSALAAIASISGMPMNEFLFLGYPPAKRKRLKFFAEVASSPRPVVLYESPHRIEKTLRELRDAAGDAEVVVGRELTKMFEEILRGRISEVAERFEKKGEFVIVVNPETP